MFLLGGLRPPRPPDLFKKGSFAGGAPPPQTPPFFFGSDRSDRFLSYKVVLWVCFLLKMFLKTYFGCIFTKKSYKIVFWVYFCPKIFLKSHFGMY